MGNLPFSSRAGCQLLAAIIATFIYSAYAQSNSSVETITYHDNTSKWVLGQVASISVNGIVAQQTTYDASSALPLQSFSYSKLKQTLAYNADGTVASVKDGKNSTTMLSGWRRGIPQNISYADGATQSAVVDDGGWITAVTDQNGYTTSYGYDVMGRLASTNYPGGDSVAWAPLSQVFVQVQANEYGIAAGHWRQTLSTGAATKVTYFDAFWRPLLVTEYDANNPSGTQRFIGYEYDHEGRVTFASYPSSSSNPDKGVWTTYDTLGRPISVSQDSEHGLLTTTTSYLNDASGAYTLVRNPRGGEVRTWFQMFDRPSYDAPVRIIQPEGSLTTLTRDVFGKPMSITRGSNDGTTSATRTYRYNAYQELCASVEPETGATLMGYDAAGNLAWTAAGLAAAAACESDGSSSAVAARRVIRAYDNRNQLTSLAFPDGNGNQNWTYTPDGKPSQIITQNDGGANQTVNTYTYNKRRLLVAETSGQVGWYNATIGYGYDQNGALAGVQYPSGLYVDYAPNALGQPTRAGNFATNVAYYPNGGMSQFVYGNGIVHSMQQNARQLPSRVNDAAVLDNSYSYDASGNVVTITDALDANRNRTMVYDGLDRLTRASSTAFGGDGQFSYSYDSLDNLRTTKLNGIKQHNYLYDANNRLTNITNDAGATTMGFAYDVQGNLSNKNGQVFQFDYGNRLRAAAAKEAYRYDGHGRRALSWSPVEGTVFSMYGYDGLLRRQNNERKANNAEYIYLNGSLVAKISESTAPSAPSVSAPAYSANGSYTVTWSAVTSATTYEVQEQFNGGAWQPGYGGASLSMTISGKAGGSYSYRARACRGAICGGWGATASVSVQAVPAGAPAVSAPALSNNGSFTVSWTAVSGAENYKLEESVNGAGWTQIQHAPALSLAVTSRANGSYNYRVSACNAAGCGGLSNVATVTVVHAPASAPSLTTPASSTNGSYVVGWTAVGSATSYRLEEQLSGSSWTQIYDGSAGSYTASGKGSGTYLYRVRACNQGGCSPYSSQASVTVLLPPSGAPALSVPATSNNGAYTVSWTALALAVTYRMEESVNGGGWTLIHNEGSTTRNIGGKAAGSYSYRVQACNSTGCGAYSATGTVTVSLAPPPVTITDSLRINFTLHLPTGNTTYSSRCSVAWSSTPNATYYELRASTGAIQYSGSTNAIAADGTAYCATSHTVRACNSSGCSAYSDPPRVQTIDDQDVWVQ